jgi:hypothetical protein
MGRDLLDLAQELVTVPVAVVRCVLRWRVSSAGRLRWSRWWKPQTSKVSWLIPTSLSTQSLGANGLSRLQSLRRWAGEDHVRTTSGQRRNQPAAKINDGAPVRRPRRRPMPQVLASSRAIAPKSRPGRGAHRPGTDSRAAAIPWIRAGRSTTMAGRGTGTASHPRNRAPAHP